MKQAERRWKGMQERPSGHEVNEAEIEGYGKIPGRVGVEKVTEDTGQLARSDEAVRISAFQIPTTSSNNSYASSPIHPRQINYTLKLLSLSCPVLHRSEVIPNDLLPELLRHHEEKATESMMMPVFHQENTML